MTVEQDYKRERAGPFGSREIPLGVRIRSREKKVAGNTSRGIAQRPDGNRLGGATGNEVENANDRPDGSPKRGANASMKCS